MDTEPPQVLVTDLGMPRVDGFQLIAMVRGHHNPRVRRVPAAALTAYARSEDRVRALRSGFQIQLAKPIDPSELVTAVAAIANRFGPTGLTRTRTRPSRQRLGAHAARRRVLGPVLAQDSPYDGESGVRDVLMYRPDVVLLDIGMPGLDGFETCRRIRRELRDDVLVVAVTGFGQQQDKERATRDGFDAHLTKPADPAALERLLRQCGSGARNTKSDDARSPASHG